MTNLEGQVFPSTMWTPGIKLRLLDLAASGLPSHLTDPHSYLLRFSQGLHTILSSLPEIGTHPSFPLPSPTLLSLEPQHQHHGQGPREGCTEGRGWVRQEAGCG